LEERKKALGFETPQEKGWRRLVGRGQKRYPKSVWDSIWRGKAKALENLIPGNTKGSKKKKGKRKYDWGGSCLGRKKEYLKIDQAQDRRIKEKIMAPKGKGGHHRREKAPLLLPRRKDRNKNSAHPRKKKSVTVKKKGMVRGRDPYAGGQKEKRIGKKKRWRRHTAKGQNQRGKLTLEKGEKKKKEKEGNPIP